MEKFSYSDICDALGPIWGDMASDPNVKSVVCKFLAFQSNSKLFVDSKNGIIKIKCTKKVFGSIVLLVNKWLVDNYVPAEDVYYEILEHTNFSRSIVYADFIKKLQKTGAGVISCVITGENSQKESYFMDKRFVKSFIAVEYGEEYRKANYIHCSGYKHIGDEIPGANIAFYKQNQESTVLPCAISQPLVFQNFMEPKRPYIRDMDKKETLDGLINTLIKRHQDLEKQQTVLEPNEKREEKIKSIIMNLVFVLKTQAEYIKKYFGQDIDVLVERYNHGKWMSDLEIKSFFYSENMQKQIVFAYGGHAR